MSKKAYLVKGDFISSPKPDQLVLHEDATILVEDGRISEIYEDAPKGASDLEVLDHRGKLIIPGFADVHLHAVQYVTRGLGYDKELLPWLNDYTFPEESRFKDPAYGEVVFKDVARDL